MNENLFAQCFDAMVKCFEENNQGCNSPWTWDDAFRMRHISSKLLFAGMISFNQKFAFDDAISVPLFDSDALVARVKERAAAASKLFEELNKTMQE